MIKGLNEEIKGVYGGCKEVQKSVNLVRQQTLINFIIYFREDIKIIKCAYAYDQVKCVYLLYELLILKAA